MTRTRLIVALLALVMALGPLACAVHPDGPGQGIALASVHDGPGCDAQQPVFTPAPRQLPGVGMVAGVALHAPRRIPHDAGTDRSNRPGTQAPGASAPLRI